MCVCMFSSTRHDSYMPLMNTRRAPLRWRAPPGGRGVHPALATSRVHMAVFLKPPSHCWYYACALVLLLQARSCNERQIAPPA